MSLCGTDAGHFATLQDIPYFEYGPCDFIFAEPTLLAHMDAGQPVREYNERYWRRELASARERSFGSSLARAAEAM